MDGETTEALLAALCSLATGGDVGAMVLTGQGVAFSAGGDVETIKEMGQDHVFRDAILGAHQRLFHTMTRLPFASVAAVNGAAVGAGVTAALLCDLVVMADTAFLSDPRVSLGLLDGAGGIVLWPLLTSLSAAKEHLLLGDRVGGDEAHRLGLVNRVVPQRDVHVEAIRLAHRLAALPRQAATQMRRLLNAHMDRVGTPARGLHPRRVCVFRHRRAPPAAGAAVRAARYEAHPRGGETVVGGGRRLALVTGGTRGIGRAVTRSWRRPGSTWPPCSSMIVSQRKRLPTAAGCGNNNHRAPGRRGRPAFLPEPGRRGAGGARPARLPGQ